MATRVLSSVYGSRLVALLLVSSLLLPIVLLGGFSSASAKEKLKTSVRPNVAPPERFVMPGGRRGGESLGERLSGLGSEVASLFATGGQQSVGDSQTPDEGQTTGEQSQKKSEEESVNVEAEQPLTNDNSTDAANDASAVVKAAPNAGESVPAMFTQPAATVDFNFDNDAKTDIGRWHPATKEFKVNKSNGGTLTVTFSSASASAKSAPADYDGDGKTDPAVFDSGTWYINKSSDNNPATITTVSSFGQAGDIPMSGNYRNTADDELAFYRPSNGTWYWRELGNATVYTYGFGNSTDIPAVGDYDGDGDVEPVIYRPSTGDWWISSVGVYNWGLSIDIPVAADYDGDGKTDPAVYRPTDGGWWYMKSSDAYNSYGSITWGNPGDQPAVGDYDGDAEADFAVFRPNTGRWHIYQSATDTPTAHSFGQAGDTPVSSSYIKQTGGSVTADVFNAERLKPRNATGGTDLYSQNFGWSRGLVNLPGRSGHDLNLGVSYNSLVWTKVGSAMVFNPDWDTMLSPGFNIGFPTIEPAYLNSTTGVYNYLMVTPSGSRLEFRQTGGASNVYETYDSSYAQLTTTGATSPNDPVEAITIKVVTTDGTQMSYEWEAGAFRCKQIKDRNGNYITVAYDPDDQGQIIKVTDTLGREVNFNYSNGYLSTITQTWQDTNGSGSNTTHTYATFTYTNKPIAYDFDDSLTPWGLINGTALKVVDKITYADSSFTKFHYNGYGQAYLIEEHAADSTGGTPHVLNHIRVNLHTTGDGALSADQPDVPRFTQTWNMIENFNSGTETSTTNSVPTSDSETIGGSSISGKSVDVTMTSHPDGLYTRIFYGDTTWKDGLTLATQDCTGSNCAVVKRWTVSNYTQDDTGLAYQTNPRVTESKVGDGTNTKRTTIDYVLYDSTTIAAFGLPSVVKVYDTDLTTVLKEATTTYNFDSNLISRRIVGLPLTVEVEGYNQLTSGIELASKVTYAYDEHNFSDSGLVQSVSPAQHDSTNYGTGFAYRGNLTSVKRWDASDPETSGSAITTASMKYNTAGSVVSQTTPWDGTGTRTIRIGYADNFNSSPGVTTNAYPTVITAPNGSSLGDTAYSSTAKYRYDMGANVEANSPPPTGQTYGKKSKRVFDSVGRLERDSVFVHNTEKNYVRYEYPTNGVQSKTYSPIVDVDNDGNIAEDEVYTESWFDGAGRVRQSRTEHSGSAEGWASTFVEYDILGRVKRQSMPLETDAAYDWTGGDDSAGPLWTHQKYDWMGRVVRKINTDGIDDPTPNDSDILISYDGCGCAGGVVTTVEGELVPRTDTAGDARRKQKSYADILGRTFKRETYEWDGTTVHSTVVQTFDGADRAVKTRQFAGSTSSSTYQDTTASFDGHGRLYQSHRPEQRDIGDNLKYTTYNYNKDDSILNLTDGRGAVTNFEYNSIGLLTEKSWTVPGGSGIADPTDVTFSYDNLGNRTAMTDGMGTMAYAYDSLSRLTSETRDFADSLADAPNSGLFTLSYEYSLSGLKSYTDPYGQEIEFAHQKNGRLSTVTGSSFGGVTTYANNPGYRAWGSLKHLEYGNGMQMGVTYNSRFQAASHLVNNISTPSTKVFDKTYDYYADGNLKLADDSVSGSDRFDRLFTYDHQGSVKDAKSGIEAHGQTQTNLVLLPYRQTYNYDAFGHITERDSTLWNKSGGWDFIHVYENNRSNYGYYDNDGRQTSDNGAVQFEYDGAGTMSKTGTDYDETYLGRDGDGRELKRSQRVWEGEDIETGEWGEMTSRYFIPSSVLGQNVTEADTTGKKRRTYVIAAGTVVARQGIDQGTTTEHVGWQHIDPSGLSSRTTYANGNGGSEANTQAERDALGNNVGFLGVFSNPNLNSRSGSDPVNFGMGANDRGEVEVDGILMPVSLMGSNAIGVSQQNPDGTWSPRKIDYSRHLPGGGIRVYIPGRRWESAPAPLGPDDDPTTISVGSSGEWPGQFITVGNWSVTSTGKPAPLNDEENQQLDTRVQKLIDERLGSKDCRKFLDRLGSDAYTNLVNTLKNQSLRYSVDRSTDITVEEAGIYPPWARRNLTWQADKKNTKDSRKRQAYQDQLESLDYSVSEWAKKRSNPIHAVLGNINGQRVVFYASFKKITTIVHENLHISSGKNDVDLANALGLKSSNGNPFQEGDTDNASRAISEALISKGCTN